MNIERFSTFRQEGPELTELILEQENIREIEFDPERDLTPEDWADIKLITGRYKDAGNWEHFASCHAYAKTLRPTREKDSAPFLEWGVSDIVAQLRKLGDDLNMQPAIIRNYDKFDRLVYRLVELDPGAVNQERLETGSVWDRFIEGAIIRYDGSPENIPGFLQVLKAVFPTHVEDYSMKEENWRAAVQEAKRFEYSPEVYIASLVSLRLADPERYERDGLGLSKGAWEKVHKALEDWRARPDIADIALPELMYKMAILAARKVEYGPGGAVIDNTYYPESDISLPPVPMRTKFAS